MTTTGPALPIFEASFGVPQPIIASPAAGDRPTGELLSLLANVQSAGDLPQSWRNLCQGLRRVAGCERVALGIANSRGECRLAAVSDSLAVDRRSELAAASEAAMDETIRAGKLVLWSAAVPDPSPILQRLVRLATADVIACVPLRNSLEKTAGALVFYGRQGLGHSPADWAWMAAWQGPIANLVELLCQARGGFFGRLRAVWSRWTLRVRRRVLLAGVAAVGSALVIPVPYKVKCDCSIEPVRRRFLAAPFDGTLDKALVEVGDVVHAGQVLAVMDERELRWDLAGLDAEYAAAKKKRDSALAGQEGAALQLASLEMERLAAKIQTLQKRAEHLQIQCPVDGVVVSGDLKRTEGAPLTVGQTLFEIAPLEQMIAEIEVPQQEIGYVRPGLTVNLRLHAFPYQAWSGKIAKIHPRAELRNAQTVFIAEVQLANELGRLRPGMIGQAKVTTPSRSLGWIWLHRPIHALAQRVGW